MKTTKLILKGMAILIFVLIASINIGSASGPYFYSSNDVIVTDTGEDPDSVPSEKKEYEDGDVSDEVVRRHVEEHGYRVYSIEYSGEGFNRIVRIQYDYKYLYVFVEGGKITGTEEILL